MNTILLSKQIVNAYKEKGVNISYVICELLGAIDYNCSTKIDSAPINQQDVVDYPLDPAAYDVLKEKFDHLESYSEVAEILLWANYWMGARL